jgi:hypothetical protein
LGARGEIAAFPRVFAKALRKSREIVEGVCFLIFSLANGLFRLETLTWELWKYPQIGQISQIAKDDGVVRGGVAAAPGVRQRCRDVPLVGLSADSGKMSSGR